MSDPFYRSREWRRLRALVLERDPICRTLGCDRRSTVADHITPRTAGGSDTLGNVRGVCNHCHGQRSRTAREPRAAGCLADGSPRDPGHWWNQKRNLSGLGGGTGVGAHAKLVPAKRDGEDGSNG